MKAVTRSAEEKVKTAITKAPRGQANELVIYNSSDYCIYYPSVRQVGGVNINRLSNG